MRYENDPLVGLYVGSCHSSIARSLTVQQMSHRAPGVFELAHKKLAPYRTVFQAAGWQLRTGVGLARSLLRLRALDGNLPALAYVWFYSCHTLWARATPLVLYSSYGLQGPKS